MTSVVAMPKTADVFHLQVKTDEGREEWKVDVQVDYTRTEDATFDDLNAATDGKMMTWLEEQVFLIYENLPPSCDEDRTAWGEGALMDMQMDFGYCPCGFELLGVKILHDESRVTNVVPFARRA